MSIMFTISQGREKLTLEFNDANLQKLIKDLDAGFARSLKAGPKNLDPHHKAFKSSNPHSPNSQHIVAVLKHQVAVQKALDLIKERIQDIPTLGELATCSGLSRTYFSYVFKEVTRIRLRDCVIQARLDRAKDMLSNIDLKIKQIAFESGFRDPNYFCQFFKKKMGLCPTNWRLKEILTHRNHNKKKKFITSSS